MDEIPLLPDAKRNYRLYYLIPLSFVYLFVETGSQVHLLFFGAAIIGATSRHASGEAIYGPHMEEKGELTSVEKVRRTGTLIFRDKLPHQYNATSSIEMVQEGTLASRIWGAVLIILGVFQLGLSILYLVAIYFLYQNLASIGFLGGVLLFSLIALVVYGVMSSLWPDARKFDYGGKVDDDLQSIIQGFRQNLYADGVFVPRVSYEPADAGVVEIECSVDYEWEQGLRRDVNRIAYSFCSVVERSPYPITGAEVQLTSSDGGELTFVIDAELCDRMLDGEISTESFAETVQKSVLTNPPDDADN
jgi:hypothetical protein